MSIEEWIGVADVAAELHLTDKAAWEWLRRHAVPMLNSHSRTLARFRREDYEIARDASLKPLPPRRVRGTTPSLPEPKVEEGPWSSKLRGRA